MPRIIKILLSILGLILGIFLVLFVTARIAGFDSVGALLYYLLGYIGFIADRSF